MNPKGVRRDAVPEIKGAKPRGVRMRRASLPRIQNAQTIKLGEDYLRKRNRNLDIKNMRESLELAHARGQVVEIKMAERQLSWLLISMRQALLSLPVKIANHFGDRDVSMREIVPYAKQAVHEILKGIERLPDSVHPGWLDQIEDAEIGESK